jgi:hypothetical protein
MGKGQGRAVSAYLRALGISGLAVIGPPVGRPVRLIAGIYAGNKVPGLLPTHCVHSVLWCQGADLARLVADAAIDAMQQVVPAGRGGWFNVSRETLFGYVQTSADQLGIILATDESVNHHATQALATIEAEFERLQKSGALQSLNRSYREYRIAQNAAGKTAIPYYGFVWNYKLKLVASVANASRIFGAPSPANQE